jgi:hypothetical protein
MMQHNQELLLLLWMRWHRFPNALVHDSMALRVFQVAAMGDSFVVEHLPSRGQTRAMGGRAIDATSWAGAHPT